MLRNFFISATRSIFKNRVYSIINVLGLSISFATVFLIVQYVHFEKSFDQYHGKSDRIFRVGMELQYENSTTLSAGSFYGMGEQTAAELAEIEDYFTMSFDNSNQGFVAYDDKGVVKNFRLKGSHSVSPSILEILDFKFVEGSKESGLAGTSNVVITTSLARKIFGNQPALGKTLSWYDTSLGTVSGKAFQVGAVIEDLPANSHFDFEFLFPLEYFKEVYPEYGENIWTWYGYYNYLQLGSEGDKESLEQKFPEFVQKHIDVGERKTFTTSIFLEPLEDIRLKSDSQYQMEEGGDDQTVNILIAICVLLIGLAYINYTNLTTSINLQSAGEVGIRRVLGANQKQIVFQLLTQTLLTNLFSLLLAIGFILLIKPSVQNWISEYPEAYLLSDFAFWIKSVSLVLLLSLLTGIYPAVLVSKFKNTALLKGSFSRSSKGRWLHKIMVVFQFSVASVLLLFAFVINKQLNYMFSQDLGVDMEQVLVARAPLVRSGSFEEAVAVFQDQARNIPGVNGVAISTMVPGVPAWGNTVRLKGRNDEPQVVRRMEVDEYYLNVYGHQVVAGRGFSPEFRGDESKAMVNESMATLFGLTSEEMVGQTLFLNDTVEVVGVIQDYHHNSVKAEILPMVLTKTGIDIYYVSMSVQSANLTGILAELGNTWEGSFPGSPFDTFFADANFEQLYLKDQKFSKIVMVFTGAALFIAGLGLFGLSLFAVIRKRKEIGVRKVLGAPDFNIFWTFSKEVLFLILIAGLLSVPMSYLLADNWLGSFANRIGLELWMLIMPVLFTLVFALVAITYNIMKALRVNPVETLRHE